jgi:hypothetical protein
MTSNGHGDGHTATAPPLREQLDRGREEARFLGHEIGEVVRELRELGVLEAQLAKADVAEQVSLARRAAMWGAVAGLFGFMVVAFALTTTMFALSLVFEMWIAAAITTGIALGLALLAGLVAYSRIKKVTVVPRRSMDSVKKDVQWAREQIASRTR